MMFLDDKTKPLVVLYPFSVKIQTEETELQVRFMSLLKATINISLFTNPLELVKTLYPCE